MNQISMFDNVDTTANEPLAERLRPRTLEEFAGQKHLIGKGKVLSNLIANDRVTSMIFWGPPGVGKTTLAKIIANTTQSRFITFSAVTSGIKEIRQVMQEAEQSRRFGERTIVFIDEIDTIGKKRDGQKALKDIQRRLFHIAPPSGILDAAFKHSHHQSRGKQGPAQIGEKQHHALHPVHLEELCAHAAHLGKEVPKKAHHLTVKPVHDLPQYFVRYKVPYKQFITS